MGLMYVSIFNLKNHPIMKHYSYFLLLAILFGGCAKNALDNNIDRKNPTEISAQSLFSGATLRLAQHLTSPSVNLNVFRFWTQQWTMTTYHDEVQYNFTTRNIPREFWNKLHVEVLKDLAEASLINEGEVAITAAQKANQAAQLDILSILTWQIIVDTWGDVPYFEALSDSDAPSYTAAATIYADLLTRLDNAISSIDISVAGFGQADLIYGGNISNWLKFAHSLRLRLAITLADIPTNDSQRIILESANLAFQSNADNASFKFSSATPNNNPISTNLNPLLTARLDYVAANTLVNELNRLADPRVSRYFTAVNGVYIGGQIGAANTFSATSNIHPAIQALDFEALLIDYAEVAFILAEAAERWNNLGSDAHTYYDRAITASIHYWGGTDAEVQAYLQQPTVAYTSAYTDWRQKIGYQKWIALYNRGFESWKEWRRLDFPALDPAIDAVAPGTIPLRLTYPTDEYTINRVNLESALANSGADQINRPLFWDIN